MTPLRERMIEDMTLAGLAPATQVNYIQAVRQLAGHDRRSPDQLEPRRRCAPICWVSRERGVALGTFKTAHGGILFLFSRTLDLEWPLFSKKGYARPSKSAYLTCSRTLRSAPFSAT